MDSNFAKASAATVLAAGVGVGAIFAVANSQRHDREGKIVIAASNAQYVELASHYQDELRKYGVQVEVRRTTRVTNTER